MTIPQLDLMTAPLTGRTLIEASAGTGKTYTIAALFVRLLVEKELELDQILVVTFTEAATAELRDRIRQRIVEAIAVFAEEAEDAEFLSPLRDRQVDRSDALRRLKRALIAFDQAAIHTIHGFCQRVLRDRAFEARALFDTELVTDLSALEQQLADDFWQARSAAFPPVLADFLFKHGFGPDKLLQLARLARRPERILPESSAPELITAEAPCVALQEQLRGLWLAERATILADLLSCAPGMRKNAYTLEKIHDHAREFDALVASQRLWGAGDGVKFFSAPQANKGNRSPEHPFFALCAEFAAARHKLSAACASALIALQRDYLLWREGEATIRKAHRNVRTFDDLLLDVRRVIAADAGAGLLAALQASFRAILIDEFQDTDPVQYAIFHSLCPDASATLFLIGDPKQAIYAFRGADIFTYLEATCQVEQRFTLGVNYRSAPGLVSAVNRLFSRNHPFLFERIPYPEVQAAEQNIGLALLEGGVEDPAPQRCWFVPQGEGKKGNKGEATEQIVAAVVAEIARLLSCKAELRSKGATRPLCAGDVAVLVRSNRQAALVQQGLLAAGVASVRQGTESLFASREAGELLRVLLACAEPGNLPLVRGALVTALFGLDAAALARTVEEEGYFEQWLEPLRSYHRLWKADGIATMTGALLHRERLPVRLLALADGERRLTNLRHCFEVLHYAESEHGFGLEGLLKWFSRQVADPPAGEEYQLRLETDDRAVQVVTIHRSKGLEYPVTFVPFCWNGSRPYSKSAPFLFHLETDGAGRGALALDLGTAEELRCSHQEAAVRENLAENLRLLYVALTRAQARCYFVWGNFREAASSAPAWLLHGPEAVVRGDEVAALEAAFADLDDSALRSRLQQVGGTASDLPQSSILTPFSPALETAEALIAPQPFEPLRSSWRLTSYSALSAASHHPAEGEGWKQAERGDELRPLLPEEPVQRETIHEFPRGAEAGSCLHDILESIDFTDRDPLRWRPVIEANLERYKISLSWVTAVEMMLVQVLSAPLNPGEPSLRLGQVSLHERCSEMGFFLPLGRVGQDQLVRCFSVHAATLPDPRLPEFLARLEFGEVEGMLRGFIDLVFCQQGRYYLIDWKSNHLGPSAADYQQERMTTEMLASGYVLQYHLYCVALHRHLQRTLANYDYERHFGGVFYLFLRGVDAAHGATGIFRDRPAVALIEDLDRLLSGRFV